jgi:hypothetical protein
MRFRQGEKGLLAGGVGAGNTIQIDLDWVGRQAAPGNGVRQAVCPFPYKLPV